MAIAPSPEAVTKLKRMVAFTSPPVLTDDDVVEVLNMYALVDENEAAPGDGSWSETFDWYGAAMEFWNWKAGAASHYVSTNADGQTMNISQVYDHCMVQVQRYTELRQTGTVSVSGPGEQ